MPHCLQRKFIQYKQVLKRLLKQLDLGHLSQYNDTLDLTKLRQQVRLGVYPEELYQVGHQQANPGRLVVIHLQHLHADPQVVEAHVIQRQQVVCLCRPVHPGVANKGEVRFIRHSVILLQDVAEKQLLQAAVQLVD